MEVDELLNNEESREEKDLPADPCQPAAPQNWPHCSTMQPEQIVGHVVKRGRLYYMYVPGYGLPPMVKSPISLPPRLIAQFEYEFAQKGPSMFPPAGLSYNAEVAEIMWTGQFDGTPYALLRHVDYVHRLVPLHWAQVHFPEMMRRYFQSDPSFHHQNQFKNVNSRTRWNPLSPSQPRRLVNRTTQDFLMRPMYTQHNSNTYNFNGPIHRASQLDLQVPPHIHNQLPHLMPLSYPDHTPNSLPNTQPLNLQPPPSFLVATNQNALNPLNNPEPLAILDSVATTLSQVITDVQKSASNIVVSEDPYKEKLEGDSHVDEEVPPDPFNISSTLQLLPNQRMCSVNTTTVLCRRNRKLTHDEAMDSDSHGFAGSSVKRRRM